MSTQIIHQPVTVSEDELASAYYRLAYPRKPHAKKWTPDAFDAEYIAYVQRGRHIPDGHGDHRAEGDHRNGKYAHFSYGVVERGWV
jgi:hypothetical protein